jgi:hypothetical protein
MEAAVLAWLIVGCLLVKSPVQRQLLKQNIQTVRVIEEEVVVTEGPGTKEGFFFVCEIFGFHHLLQ